MTSDEATTVLAATLHQIAPEVNLGTASPGLPSQEVADLDSMDFLNLVTAIHDSTGIEIPFRDYARLSTLKLFVSYLMSASSAPDAASMYHGPTGQPVDLSHYGLY